MAEWEPTMELRRYDDTPKLTNPRLQQKWRQVRPASVSFQMFHDEVVYEWRDVPLFWDKEKARRDEEAIPPHPMD